MSGPQITQAEYWNGEAGQRWVREQAAFDRLFAPLTEALFAGLSVEPGQALLDIGCGAGTTTLIAARRGARATGADISEPLLALARTRAAAEGLPVDWRVADVERDDLGGGFEHALSRFGVMFFGDSAAAFARIRGALRPGGRLMFLCWQGLERNAWAAVPRAAVLPLVPEPPPPPPDAPGPFRFADPETLSALLVRAGFAAPDLAAVERPLLLAAGATETEVLREAARIATDLGPASYLLRNSEPAVQDTARAAVAEALRPHLHEGRVHLGAACWLVTAQVPAAA